MEGTTHEQNKIRRATLLISVLLLLSSVGSYLLYQHFYQPQLTVTFVSKKVLPNTRTPKKMSRESNKVQVDRRVATENNVSKDVKNVPFIQNPIMNENAVKESNPAISEAKIFKLSDEIEILP